jgi:hypothetical protein
MCPRIMMNVSPKGERFKSLECLPVILVTKNLKRINCPKQRGEAFGEGFKSHKYMIIIYIHIYILIFHLFTPHTHTRDAMRARV